MSDVHEVWPCDAKCLPHQRQRLVDMPHMARFQADKVEKPPEEKLVDATHDHVKRCSPKFQAPPLGGSIHVKENAALRSGCKQPPPQLERNRIQANSGAAKLFRGSSNDIARAQLLAARP